MYFIGVDLGGTNIGVGIVSETGEILIKDSVDTKRGREMDGIVADMAKLIFELLDKQKLTLNDIKSAGIGSPGLVYPPTGTLLFSNNLNVSDAPIASMLQEYLHIPVYLENDANCAALGESVCGAAKDYNNSITITLGTGVGSGIIINNQIYSGSFYGGGEVGHHVIVFNGRPCSCSRKGCFESYSSATALIKEAKNVALENPDSLLNELCNNDLNNMNAKIPFEAALKGDKAAKILVEEYYEYLGCGLMNLINIFQPEVIVLGGGISAQGKSLIDNVNKYIDTQIYGNIKSATPTELVLADLGNDAGIIGAAMLGRNQ